jgi:periplasmic divalent cation tolerance protein
VPCPPVSYPAEISLEIALHDPNNGGTIPRKEVPVPEHLVVLMTTGSQEEADQIADRIVAERLAACVNIVPGITSVYRWQGQVERDQEWLLVAKTHSEALDRLVQRVQELHSYDVPEIIALPLTGGSEVYLRWIDAEVGSA